MGRIPEDATLGTWARAIEQLRWSAFIMDDDYRLVWTSSELEDFLGHPNEEELGYGLNAVEALTRDAWLRVITPESQSRMFLEVAPYLIPELRERGVDVQGVVPEHLAPLLNEVEAKPLPPVLAASFDYIEPDGESDLPVYRVDVAIMFVHDAQGRRAGSIAISYMGVRPTLVSLLARGDEEMYERMAKLMDPGPRQAAILFCDLYGSTDISRRLPSVTYFRLIRRLWTDIDRAVADNAGIIGKHAGDGASAFFLVDDLGSPSAAAAAAIRTARAIHEVSAQIFGEVIHSGCVMRVGLHWGANLYMGQLVPGGRLDVTALGDEVNECARIQECAGQDETLASKQLIEQLSIDAAAGLGLDLEKLSYQLAAEIADAGEKAKREIGSHSLTRI